ncbi:alpha/beta fold hydrolase [Sneathiella sp. CAU 1612]|jgi:pimeloyl-ACP methyl ester carboxylesterase|uniref:Alpha/beta fold hydrolase n=1 Tax=Sneathiella sedimenti TaxID=2816034 RepID=A0ABS3F962_9PROT|nr:alpha/beta hydrolase [Sneathiella sedimenti]MBO0335054.1 alpha/beta fold hydrolase [Sneathiella sedimenti]
MTEKHSLVLVPGLLCTADLWRDQISALSDIAEITIGDHTQDDSMSAIARRILDAAPEKFALAGLSMGGYIALEIMRHAPERVTHLAIMDSRAVADTPEERQKRIDFIKLVEQGSAFKGVTRSLLPILIHESRLEDEELVARIFKMAEDVGKDAFLRQERASLDRIALWDVLKTITCPTMVLSGADDKLTPAKIQREMAVEIPTAQYVEIPNCGHLPTMEEPEMTSKYMRHWLART